MPKCDEIFPNNILSPNTDGTHGLDTDKDGTREQFAIASIILQLSQQCSQPQAKRRRGRDSETMQEQSIASQIHQLTSSVPIINHNQGHADPQNKVRSDIANEINGTKKNSSILSNPSCTKALSDTADSNPDEIRELGVQAWEDEFVEGVGYCASVSSEEDKGSKSEMRRTYRCSKCGAEKKGHVCAAKVKEQAASSPTLGMKRGDLAARLAARLHASNCNISTCVDSTAQCSSISNNYMAFNRPASSEYVRSGMDGEGRSTCGIQAGSELWQYSTPDSDDEPPSGPLAKLPFFRSFRVSEWVQTPSGVALSLVGSWAPPIPSS